VGQAYVRLEANHTHAFKIAEFRRPEFEVTVTPSSPGPHVSGDEVTLTTHAKYFSGGGLPAAKVQWQVEARPGSFTPPGRKGWQFGVHVPWWARDDFGVANGRGGFGMPRRRGAAQHVQRQTTTTDAAGKHHLAVALGRLSPPRPMTLSAQATVHDVNRQAWTGKASLLVHPADVYVGLRPKRPYVKSGGDLEVDVLVVDLDGKAIAGREVAVVFERTSWDWRGGRMVEEVAEQSTQTLTSGAEPKLVSLKAPTGGSWKIRTLVADAGGRRNMTETRTWVAGGKAPSSQQAEEEKLTLIPDKETYGHGDQAEVLIVSPFAPAEGLLTVRRSGIVRTVRFHMKEPTHVETVAIDDGLVPGATVHVALVGKAPREGAKGKFRPAFAAGQVYLKVPPTRRTLSLDVAPAAKELEPSAETAATVTVTDHTGKPVQGVQVALAVVDEAVLSLAGHSQPDPVGFFYPRRPPGARDARSRSLVQLQRPDPEVAMLQEGAGEEMAMAEADGGAPMPPAAAAPGGARMRAKGGRGAPVGNGDAPPPIDLRKDLRALAVFTPGVETDAQGRATVRYTLPDSVTRYRIVAVAADKERSFGSGEATLTARLPLIVRPSLPRFLNFGDACELPVVVQNQTGEPLTVQVALRASNLALTGAQGLTFTLPSRDRREIRFPARAEEAGEVLVQVATASGSFADAQQVRFPVWTPATGEAFATYGVLDGEAAALAQPIRPPQGAWPQFGGLEVTTSSTGLQALTDAVIYLTDYPYGCAEQISSRVLALAAVRDVLQAFQADGLPSDARLEQQVGMDVQRLMQLQNPDGGWGFWRPGETSWPYLTVHVSHALHLAQAKGYSVPQASVARAKGYLKTIEGKIPSWYSAKSRRALTAYALHVRAKLGAKDSLRAKTLVEEAPLAEHSLETLGWVYPLLRAGDPALARKVRRHFGNKVVETAGAANFTTSYTDGAHVLLHSARRVDGVILDALLTDPAEVQGDLAPKLVQGLLAHRRKGRWGNTQENAFVLLALDRYFRTAEKVTPDFVARAWLGDAFAGEHAFRGRTTERSSSSPRKARAASITGSASATRPRT
jgi:uncharacterized protein YfaS (alpha-2-macroglobulin family)